MKKRKTKQNNEVCTILFIQILFLLFKNTISSFCPNACGRFKLHFPFGVGKGCYLNEDYEVECRNSLPFLRKLNKEIVRLDVPRPMHDEDEFFPLGSLRIRTHITSVGCSGSDGDEFQQVLNFTGTPFTIGDSHTVVAVGCDNKATTMHLEPRLVGCVSSCDLDILANIPWEEQGKRCNGYKCCNVNIAGDVGQGLERYLWCACTSGYEGNPYELDGCKDIDECKLVEENRRPKYCINGETCQNLQGSYRCVINKDKTLLIYIGVGVGLSLLLVGVGIWLYKVIKKHLKINQRKRFFNRNGGLLLQQQLTSVQGSVEKTKVFSCEELEKATESFSLDRVLGQGGQGTVYKGMLVAVKKSKAVEEENLEEFINEVVVLSQINFLHAMKENRLFDIIDPRIRDHCNLGQVTVMAKIANMCLKLIREKRPTMREVSMELERICSSHGDSHVSAIGNDEDEDEDEQVTQLYRRSRSLNIEMASTSRSQHDYHGPVRSDTEPLFSHLS